MASARDAAPSPPTGGVDAIDEGSQRVRGVLANAGEVLVAVAFCLLFYATIHLLLGVVFPQGVGLRDLIGRSGAGHAPSGGALTAQATTAVLTVLKSNVRAKRASEIAWQPASSGTVLRGGDGVQTASRGEAKIVFEESHEVRLGRNSLIVIKNPSSGNRNGAAERVALSVVSGEVWANLPAGDGRAMEIEAGPARVQIRPDAATGSPSRVQVRIKADQNPTFVVQGGTADIEAYGKMVRLQANEYTTVDETGPLEPRVVLPATMLIAPGIGERLANARVASGVRFVWKPLADAEAYRLVVSHDPNFERVVLDTRARKASYRTKALGEGQYYWRVSGIAGGADGAMSPTGRFSVERSLKGPRLTVALPPPLVHGDRHVIEGKTAPGAVVVAAGNRTVANADGRFAIEVALEPGMNAIVVEAIDQRGNSSYKSAIVNAKIKGR